MVLSSTTMTMTYDLTGRSSPCTEHGPSSDGLHQPCQWHHGVALYPGHPLLRWKSRGGSPVLSTYARSAPQCNRLSESRNCYGIPSSTNRHPGHDSQHRIDVEIILELGKGRRTAKSFGLRMSTDGSILFKELANEIQVDSVKRVPARAVLFSISIVFLLTLINFGSSVAFQVFTSLSTISMYVSYFIAILMMVFARLSSSPPPVGPWTMGRLGMPVNLFALVYTAYIIVWLPFPTTMPITGANFNYSSPILGFVILAALALWMVKRKTWPGLREDVIEVAINK